MVLRRKKGDGDSAACSEVCGETSAFRRFVGWSALSEEQDLHWGCGSFLTRNVMSPWFLLTVHKVRRRP